ncbi:sulfite oxidase [Halobacillus sp. Marseille-Q1614]|uniref:sulfite oxidase n=1 Tax=Halobacillus sp. Marseille-Q1614 TaxID=2709134 RepID=UPI00156FB100|nr:sulfite oxidase [Halobacillus sp. Marseille-Q1614]
MSNYSLVKPYLITRSVSPENQETPISFVEADRIENRLFYRRNHFSYPNLSYTSSWLPVNGAMQRPTLFSMEDLFRFPSKTIKVLLECAGNKRSLFEPKVFGEQWEKGAVSQGYWTGVPLKSLLEYCGLSAQAKEVVIEGYDQGKRPDTDKVHPFKRSLPIDKALHPDTLVAYQYNGQPLPYKHGCPLRLIVPQWYAMASVKWIKQIRVIESEFEGPFQSIDYIYYPNKDDNEGAFPVTTLNVNSTIQKPVDHDKLDTGQHTIKGIAYTGEGKITQVEISTDGGKSWTNASLENEPSEYEWVSWSHQWPALEKGEYTIMTRAADSTGRIQPMKPFWNRKGYGYNAVDQIKVKIE